MIHGLDSECPDPIRSVIFSFPLVASACFLSPPVVLSVFADELPPHPVIAVIAIIAAKPNATNRLLLMFLLPFFFSFSRSAFLFCFASPLDTGYWILLL